MVVYQFGERLFFANIKIFQQDIENSIKEDTKAVIVDGGAISSIDLTAADRLEILADNLEKQGIHFYLTEDVYKRQVVRMALENYDLEKYEKAIKKESYEEGYQDGQEKGICQLIKALQKFSITQENVLQTLQEKYDLSEKEAEEYMKKYV